MRLDDWLASACADAERRGLPELKPLLESLADATRALRSAAWEAGGQPAPAPAPPAEPADGVSP